MAPRSSASPRRSKRLAQKQKAPVLVEGKLSYDHERLDEEAVGNAPRPAEQPAAEQPAAQPAEQPAAAEADDDGAPNLPPGVKGADPTMVFVNAGKWWPTGPINTPEGRARAVKEITEWLCAAEVPLTRTVVILKTMSECYNGEHAFFQLAREDVEGPAMERLPMARGRLRMMGVPIMWLEDAEDNGAL